MIKKTKIIRNYNLNGTKKKAEIIPKLIRNSDLDETVKIPSKSKIKKKKTEIEEVKNNQGFVVGLKISCSCGEEINIEFDYE